MSIPENPDWFALVDNLRSQGKLYAPSSVARAAKVHYRAIAAITGGKRDDVRFTTGAKLVNLHAKLLPGVPIPEKSE